MKSDQREKSDSCFKQTNKQMLSNILDISEYFLKTKTKAANLNQKEQIRQTSSFSVNHLINNL